MARDGVGRRVPLLTLTRALLTLAAGFAAVVGFVWSADGTGEGALVGVLLVVIGGVGLGAATLLVRRRTQLGSLHRQVSAVAAIAVGQTVFASALLALVMFVSTHDAVLICLVSAFAGLSGLFAVQIATRPMLADVQAVADGMAAIGAGTRTGDVRTTGADELAVLAQQTNRTAGRLQSEAHARRNLLAAVSHDLRTPITSLRLLVAALGDDLVVPEERVAFLERMQLHVSALSALIDDLFELSRLEAGDIAWSMHQVHLRMLVGDTVDAMREQADAKGVVLRCEVPGDLPAARANPEKLQRVLFNLIQNAIRHTPADGSVCVCAVRAEGALEVEVRDTGEGIAPGEGDRLFEPFARGAGRESRGEHGSSGLGLAIARGIVEAHAGRIWIEPATRGARVRFSLPTAAPQ